MPAGGIIRGPKTDFKGPEEIDREQRQAQEQAQRRAPVDKDSESIDRASNALSGKDAEDNEKELKALEVYSKEDMRLAEELLFRGYAEKDFKILPNTTITITSMTSAATELVNEMVYEYASKKDEEGNAPDLSAKVVEGRQQMLLVALGFKGINGADISPASGRSLSFIKSGMKRMSDAEIDGDIKKFNETRAELKKIIWARASELKRIPVSIIDAVAKRRFEFERIMFEITSREDLIPKS